MSKEQEALATVTFLEDFLQDYKDVELGYHPEGPPQFLYSVHINWGTMLGKKGHGTTLFNALANAYENMDKGTE